MHTRTIKMDERVNTMKVNLSNEQWKMVEEALNMSEAFAVYGDGRDEHKAKIKEIKDAIVLEWTRENVPF